MYFTTTAVKRHLGYFGRYILEKYIELEIFYCLIFRTSDAVMVANYRVQAELTAVESTTDGNALVLGTIDGCVSVLAIVDPFRKDMNEFIAAMPSRDEGVSFFSTNKQ